MTTHQPHTGCLLSDELRYLEEFQLAIDGLRGIAAQNPALAARLNAVADRCQAGYGFLESAFWHDATRRNQRRTGS
jgi:hypothetical protein